jgi:hypothetical protein
MANFTLNNKQIEALNDWVRTDPALRRSFPYAPSNGLGFGDYLNQLGSATGDDVASLRMEVDFVSDTLLYQGFADPGTLTSEASWRIMKITFTGADEDVSRVFANGTNDFVHVWDNRAALSYTS